MSFQPSLSDVQLDTCCQKSIQAINRILWSGKWLQRLIIPATFASLYVSPSDSAGRGGAMTTIAAIHQTDWSLLVEATMSISDIAKRECMNVSFQEALRHGGELKKFWEGLVNVFS